jgi:Uncharacterized conserved protein
MKSAVISFLRIGALVFGVSVLVSVPFMIWGEEVFVPAFEGVRHSVAWMVGLAVALLSLDAVLPVPSSWVIIFLAQESGRIAGFVGGSVGLAVGVVVAAWLGRAAVGRVAPKFIPEAEIERMRAMIERHTILTLACMRSVPVLAETSVVIAAAAGVPVRKIFWMTLGPNVAIAAIYAVAGDESLLTACIVFLATVAVSYAVFRIAGRASELAKARSESEF